MFEIEFTVDRSNAVWDGYEDFQYYLLLSKQKRAYWPGGFYSVLKHTTVELFSDEPGIKVRSGHYPNYASESSDLVHMMCQEYEDVQMCIVLLFGTVLCDHIRYYGLAKKS